MLAILVDTSVKKQGFSWITTTSIRLVTLTSMQIQDLKNQAGDRKSGRCNVSFVFGDTFSCFTIAMCVIGWSF